MVDSSTRNITLQATLENPDHALRPGMFAKAEVTLPEKHKALVVPGSAISYAPFGDSVFVIEKKKDEKTGKESQVIRQQFVRVGEARGDLVAITQGLKGRRNYREHGSFQTAKRNDGDDQQRSGAEPAGKSEPNRFVAIEERHEILH
jgi:membrane fusion protein (multidrug efflux system)